MPENSLAYLGLTYLAIGVAFAWLADAAALRELPTWYRRERAGWLACFGLLWPLCLVLLVLLWRLDKGEWSLPHTRRGPQRRASARARKHPPRPRQLAGLKR